MPKTYPSATIDTSDETALVYEWALGERDAEGEPIKPLRFPLHNVHVIVNGNRATISLPRPHQPNLVLDKLMNVAEPKTAGGRRNKGEGVVVTGVSERMLKQGIIAADAVVSFTVSGFNVTGVR